MDLSIPMENHEGEISVAVSAITVWLIQGLKGIKIRNGDGEFSLDRWARPISVAIAFLTSLGFTGAIDGSLFKDGWVLTISGPGVITLLTHFVGGSVGQHYFYQIQKGIVQNKKIIEQLGKLLESPKDDPPEGA